MDPIGLISVIYMVFSILYAIYALFPDKLFPEKCRSMDEITGYYRRFIFDRVIRLIGSIEKYVVFREKFINWIVWTLLISVIAMIVVIISV